MRTFICGHATLLVETADQIILIDPVFTADLLDGALSFFPQRTFFPDRMPRPTLLVVTHGHFDHFHPESLTTVSRDLPVVMPPDAELLTRINAAGFRRICTLEPWQGRIFGNTSLTATSSDHEEPEFGLIIKDAHAALWHMADGEVDPEDGRRALDAAGKIDVIACKYQPVVIASMSYLRGIGSGFAAQVCAWLEAACTVKPRFIFPYASGLCFAGEHSWFNRYAFPLTQDDTVALLRRRLGPESVARTVYPGDVIDADWQAVRYLPQSAAFVEHQLSTAPAQWEPIDVATLACVRDVAVCDELRKVVPAFLAGPLARWLAQALQEASSMWRSFIAWDVVWQLAVHLTVTERITYTIDFRNTTHITLAEGKHPDANFFTHLAGDTLHQVLSGKADGILFWLVGAARSYEKIIDVKGGHFWFPDLPYSAHLRPIDPLTFYLRHYWNREQADRLLEELGRDEHMQPSDR
jgi:L-ascorbate metabolism protein UlaG (beta-lactamase superfamily)